MVPDVICYAAIVHRQRRHRLLFVSANCFTVRPLHARRPAVCDQAVNGLTPVSAATKCCNNDTCCHYCRTKDDDTHARNSSPSRASVKPFELGVRTPTQGVYFWAYGTPRGVDFRLFHTSNLPIFGIILSLFETTKMCNVLDIDISCQHRF